MLLLGRTSNVLFTTYRFSRGTMELLGFCLILAVTLTSVDSSKILALMTVPSHSHHLWNSIYLEALAKKGHEITYLGVDHYKNKPANIKHILMDNAYELYNTLNFTELSHQDPYSTTSGLDDWEDIVASLVTRSKGFQEFLSVIKKETFDLVVFDLGSTWFLLGAVDLVGRPPMVGITPFSIPPWVFEMTGTPYPISNNPHLFLKYGANMTFFERLNNAGLYIFSAIHRIKHIRIQNQFSQKMFGEVRHLDDITDDMNINIVNGNWATDFPFPTAPGLIPIAGLHIAPPKPLPQDLQKYLDSSPEGVVYFSLGTNIQSSFLQEKQIKALNEGFRQLAPVKVLWKWEKDELPGKPDNVKIAKWLPQNDLLAHPNVHLFFTHGGMLSSQEAIYHGKPIVGMPIFLDQHVNIKKAVAKGYGESLNLDSISPDEVAAVIKKVLQNRCYKETAEKFSRIFRDQPNDALSTAVYWTEYAIRHNGALHLRPASKNLHWLQSGLYDIIAVAVLLIILSLAIVFKFLKLIISLVAPKSKSKID